MLFPGHQPRSSVHHFGACRWLRILRCIYVDCTTSTPFSQLCRENAGNLGKCCSSHRASPTCGPEQPCIWTGVGWTNSHTPHTHRQATTDAGTFLERNNQRDQITPFAQRILPTPVLCHSYHPDLMQNAEQGRLGMVEGLDDPFHDLQGPICSEHVPASPTSSKPYLISGGAKRPDPFTRASWRVGSSDGMALCQCRGPRNQVGRIAISMTMGNFHDVSLESDFQVLKCTGFPISHHDSVEKSDQ